MSIIIDNLLENELQNAQQPLRREYFIRHEKINGVDKIVLEVESFAHVSADDYLRNKFIQDSDNLRVYYFDAQTKLLQNLEIYVHTENQDVLIFEITDIELNTQIDPTLFEPHRRDAHQPRNTHGLFVHQALLHQMVRTHHIAVVARVDNDGVVRQAKLPERIENCADT